MLIYEKVKFCFFLLFPFEGISIIEADDSGIVMELEMNWDANSSIILDIKTYLGVALPIQVNPQHE